MITDSCGCCGVLGKAPSRMAQSMWCPVCERSESRRRCQSDCSYQEGDPLKELNRCCDKSCDFMSRPSRHSQSKKTELEVTDKRIVQMYSGEVAMDHDGYHFQKHHSRSMRARHSTTHMQLTADCCRNSGLPYMSENPRYNGDYHLDRRDHREHSYHGRQDKSKSLYFTKSSNEYNCGYGDLPNSKSLSFSEREKTSLQLREKYMQEMEVLRSKLNLLKEGIAYDGKRLRQRSESEPGFGGVAGRVVKKARDDPTPGVVKLPSRKLPVNPNVPHSCNSFQNSRAPFRRESKSLPPVGTSRVTRPFTSGKPLRWPKPVNIVEDANEPDSDLEGGACAEDVPSQDDNDISEDDDGSVLSSLTSASSDSNTPSQVGETLSSITLNESKPAGRSVAMSTPAVPCTGLKVRPPTILAKQANPFRNSLFSHVPPYVKFFMHDFKGPVLPADITRLLKWKLSTITPIVIRRTLVNSGFKLVRKSNDWTGQWGKHMKSFVFKTLKDFQKLNHFPGTFQIGRKDRLWKNLYRLMMKYGKKEFGFIPRTYILPQDSKLLRAAWERAGSSGSGQWIVKPPAAARGTGIKVVHKWGQIPKKRPLIVQKYIGRPYLINGSKFDLRLYVLMTSIHPLRVYLYDDGLVRFASVKYSDDVESLSDRFMHLTNYSINKLSTQYCANEDASACRGHKWTLKSLWTYLDGNGVNVARLQRNLTDLVIKTIISGESNITSMTKNNLPSRYCSYELFGIDVLLDEHLTPWLLEVNISPSLHSASPLDLAVKGPLVRELLNVAGFQIPCKLAREQEDALLDAYGIKERTQSLCYDKRLYAPMLSKAERLKHENYEAMSRKEYLASILEDLTPDDIRHLIQFEDELTQIGRFEKVFPTPHTHGYHQYFDAPRYYNMMLDAWETRYHRNRAEGVRLLESFCQQKIHLTVPFPGGKTKSCASQNDLTHPVEPEVDSDSETECTPPVEVRTEPSSKCTSPLKGRVSKTRTRPLTRTAYMSGHRSRAPWAPPHANPLSCNMEKVVLEDIAKSAISPPKQLNNFIKLSSSS